MNIVERERSFLEVRGPVTLPSQGRVHRSPEPPGALLSNTYKILIPLQQIGGRRPPPICCNLWKSKFYKYLDRGFSCPEERYYSSGQLGESLDLMNIVERERRAPEAQGTGDPTLPG